MRAAIDHRKMKNGRLTGPSGGSGCGIAQGKCCGRYRGARSDAGFEWLPPHLAVLEPEMKTRGPAGRSCVIPNPASRSAQRGHWPAKARNWRGEARSIVLSALRTSQSPAQSCAAELRGFLLCAFPGCLAQSLHLDCRPRGTPPRLRSYRREFLGLPLNTVRPRLSIMSCPPRPIVAKTHLARTMAGVLISLDWGSS